MLRSQGLPRPPPAPCRQNQPSTVERRYRCRACGLNFTDTPPRGKPLALPEKQSNKLWVWKAYDRATGRLVDWGCGGRDRAALKRLLKRVKRRRARLYCADGWAAYAGLIPAGRLFVGKDATHGIERDHARQRHWLARFRRRSVVVSKAERMVDASIALFARFGGNDKVQDLLAMLA